MVENIYKIIDVLNNENIIICARTILVENKDFEKLIHLILRQKAITKISARMDACGIPSSGTDESL